MNWNDRHMTKVRRDAKAQEQVKQSVTHDIEAFLKSGGVIKRCPAFTQKHKNVLTARHRLGLAQNEVLEL